MGVVVVGGTGSTGIATDIDSMVHTNSEVHTVADTGSNTDWVGIAQVDRILALV